jgi:hypothetical protein
MIIYTPSVMTNLTILISRFWIATFHFACLWCICITTNSLLKGLLQQGYIQSRLVATYKKCYGRHSDIVVKYMCPYHGYCRTYSPKFRKYFKFILHTKLTWLVPHVGQEMLTHPEHLIYRVHVFFQTCLCLVSCIVLYCVCSRFGQSTSHESMVFEFGCKFYV